MVSLSVESSGRAQRAARVAEREALAARCRCRRSSCRRAERPSRRNPATTGPGRRRRSARRRSGWPRRRRGRPHDLVVRVRRSGSRRRRAPPASRPATRAPSAPIDDARARRARRCVLRIAGVAIVDDRHAVVAARDALERAGARASRRRARPARAATRRTRRDRPSRRSRRRSACRPRPAAATPCARDVTRATSRWSGIANSLDQRGGNSAATRLDPPGAIEQQHAPALPGEVRGRRGARRSAAHHDDVEGFMRTHRPSSWNPAHPGGVVGRTRTGPRDRATREPRPHDEQQGLRREHRRVRGTGRPDEVARGVARDGAREAARAEGDRLRGAPHAHAHALASAASGGRQHHHRADRRDGERAVGRAEQRHVRAQRPRARDEPGRRQPRKRNGGRDASADHPRAQRTQPPAQARHAGNGHEDHSRQHADVLHARERSGLAGRVAEHRARERLEDQVLRAVREHRHEDEDREAARLRVGPRLAQRNAERRACGAFRRRRCTRRRALDAGDGEQRDQHGGHRDTGRHPDHALERERIEQPAGDRRRRREAHDHHHPHDRRGRGAPVGRDALREEHEQRRARRADAKPDQREREHREHESRRECAGHHRGRRGRGRAAQREHDHAADDPRRAPAADVGAVAQARPQQLQREVPSDERAGHRRGQRQLDDHHAIERRRREHDDRAQRRLHEAKPDDAEPAERRAGIALTPRHRSANAARTR